ncbi:MAG: GMP synthase [Saprospiraceae bacterium]|jgi:homoserine O-succinyltransferase/O-acetyltransferase|nr:GMP synthase [Saprospiraceae bacterium]
MEHKLRLAILDMNAGKPNQGMRCIRDIVGIYKNDFEIEEFDVRQFCEIPDLSFDVYISSGGPGNPLEGDGVWDIAWYNLIDKLWLHNQTHQCGKKHVFFVCHSFQMACNHFGLGTIAPRKSTSFGIMPVHLTKFAYNDPIFRALPDPFYAVDSRDWQLIQPNLNVFTRHGATILALEKIRSHVEYERAIMAVRFSNEFIGTQFHPEADPEGMKVHFAKDDIRDQVIKNFGQDKYDSMMKHLEDPDKIALTHKTILPNFIEKALSSLHADHSVLI